jgi:hypothetical protein
MKVLRKVLFFGIVLSLSSCATQSGVQGCRENPRFKEKFFFNISTLEKYTIEHTLIVEKHTTTEDSFLKSLNFISKYTQVPVGNVYNYNVGYTSLEEFNAQKKKWLSWYELNKCKNLH